MLTIRPAESADIDSITEIYNEAVLTTTATFDLEPRSVEDRRRWLEDRSERHPVLVATLNNIVVGWSSLSPWKERAAYNDTAETSFYVEAEHRGKGIGRKLKAAIIEEARRLGFHTLIAGCAEGSDASMHLNEAFGFERVGTFRDVGLKFGNWLDVTYFQLALTGNASFQGWPGDLDVAQRRASMSHETSRGDERT